MTTARDTIVDALDIESFVLCAGGRERQRRSSLQPRVGACAYPGSDAKRPTTLKGLHPRREPIRYNPFRVEIISHRLPRVARASQPWADGLEHRWCSSEFSTEIFLKTAQQFGASSSLTPALSPRRGRDVPRVLAKPRWSSAPRLTNFTRDGQRLFPLPAGEGQGEGEASELFAATHFSNPKKHSALNIQRRTPNGSHARNPWALEVECSMLNVSAKNL